MLEGLKFQREKAYTFFPEAMELFKIHTKEVSHYKDILLDVDFDMYNMCEEKNALRCFTVRDGKNDLIGYSVFFLKTNPHYKASFQASQDILFIHPDKRGFGKEFIKWCDDRLREEKVQVVYHHMKTRKDLNFGPMLERIGYELIDEVYGKRLDKGV